MKWFSLLRLITVLPVALCIAAASAQSLTTRAEEEAIKALTVQTTDAFNKHDAKP